MVFQEAWLLCGRLKKVMRSIGRCTLWMVSLVCSVNCFAGQPYSVEEVFAAFDPEYPGRGVDSYDHKIADHAMGYALYASAAVMKGDYPQAEKALKWLIDNSHEGKGWGLPFSWDAFSDGSVNPKDTVYGITVAWGIKAFLDYAEQTGSHKYDAVTVSVLDYYQQRFSATKNGGYFWYSNSGFDEKSVHNVSSMLAGQYARAGKYFASEKYTAVSKKAFEEVWAARKLKGNTVSWTYSDFAPAVNDSIHAAYMVYGLTVYAKANDLSLPLDGAYDYLLGFLSDGKALEYSRFETLNAELAARPARSWGVGMLAFVFADALKYSEANLFLLSLSVYQYEPGRFGLVIGDKHFFPRAQGHIALDVVRTGVGGGR